MPNELDSKIEQLRTLYTAFNARDVDSVVPAMTSDVAWPRAFKGGFVRGPEEIRAYWMEQWSEINPNVEPVSFHPQGEGQILVDVHQVVRDLSGNVMDERIVGHLYSFKGDLISKMEVTEPSATDSN